MSKLTVIGLGYLTAIAWAMLVISFMTYLGGDMFYSNQITNVPFRYSFFFTCIFAPLWEELAFRHAVIQIAKVNNEKYIVPLVILSSCYFGWLHTNGPEGVLLQGGLGIILSYVYIKNKFSYWSSVAVHFLYNVTIMSI